MGWSGPKTGTSSLIKTEAETKCADPGQLSVTAALRSSFPGAGRPRRLLTEATASSPIIAESGQITLSGFIGQMLQGVLGGNQQGSGSPIAGILQQVLSVRDGDNQGVAAIVSRFQSAGLGGVVQSWIGGGENAPISGDQVGQAFSAQQIEGWASKAGTTPDAMRDILAEALPHVVDHATPNGEVPAQSPDLSGLVARLLGAGGATRGG